MQNGREGRDLERRPEPEARLNRLTEAVIGAAIEVDRNLGPEFVEGVSENALCSEIYQRGMNFQRQPLVSVTNRGQIVGQARLDLLVESELIDELKAVEEPLPPHQA